MKKFTLFLLILLPGYIFSQGRSISWNKKNKDPYITIKGDTLRVGQPILVKEGSNPDGGFKYVQFLNGMNEPIRPADSRAAFKKQEILFFKEQDGTNYIFTKFFCINTEAAISRQEIEPVKK